MKIEGDQCRPGCDTGVLQGYRRGGRSVRRQGGPSDILTILGMAVGAIGMSVDDFCQCTPAEFRSVADAWHRAEEYRERSGWEQIRMQCLCMLQPFSKHSIEPRDVMRFLWDEEESQTEKLTAEEIRERFERVKREQGLQ